MYLTPQEAQGKYGFHPKTLSRWADEGKIECIVTPGGHRRYSVQSLERAKMSATPGIVQIDKRAVILYARVSTNTQKDDLESQIKYLGKHYPETRCYHDIASGLNFKRKNFIRIMEMVGRGEVKRIVVGHKDRLCRFGFDFVEWYCAQNDCTIEVLNNNKLYAYKELMDDFMAIMHCFSSELYFLRRYEKKIRLGFQSNVDKQLETV